MTGAGPGRLLGPLEAAEMMHATGAKRGVTASKLAALVPLGDNQTSAAGATRSNRGGAQYLADRF